MIAHHRWAALAAAATLGAVFAIAAERRALPPAEPVADMGSVSGKATFSAARPKQPIIVWLEREGGEVPGKKPAPLVIGQKGAQFNPAFAVVVVGQEVVFNNDEDKEIDHNVYTLGAEQKNFDIFPKGQNKTYAFTKTGEISLYCSVHKLMDGKLFVAPSAAWAEVGEDGSFRIPNVPAGTYTLRTYQKAKRFRDVEQKIVVKDGQATQVAVEMTR
jgi:plastocyanin